MSDKKGESFEDFVYKMQELNPHQEFSLTEFLRQTWNHQQKKIDELEKENKMQAEVIVSCGGALEQNQKLREALEEISNELRRPFGLSNYPFTRAAENCNEIIYKALEETKGGKG